MSPHSNFTTPPLDGSLTIPEIYDWHYKHNPNYPVFKYADGHNVKHLLYSDLVPAAHRAGRYIAAVTNLDVNADRSTYPIVALLSTAGNATYLLIHDIIFTAFLKDTVTAYTTLIGMLRVGVVAFPITPRFSAAVIAHLLAKTGISYIFVSAENRMHNLAQDAIAALAESDPTRALPAICSMPKFEDLYFHDFESQRLPPRSYELSSTALIVHSSCT